ncbi:FtsJ like methyltransferase Domain of unknown function (DUF3381) Spb1 C terminal domain [Trypanosoma vivax]|uniref:Putative rRNA methyltransferase n=1 Tax=Trypanosoma vivax (strain Y486) TaxID=1055687 RepID=G0TRZ6_TRYVY|nr:putative FtsJ cell division protein [Trypanosoma vivax]KAH8617382.1 FtsJ like methyltransferase Domain of unknown function (DUF3381) Spb1 C terminal domain [Trypanosoma vivax]CCC46720.1 putative FtsJ cell division protein [Trypanosoma vivax Y486]
MGTKSKKKAKTRLDAYYRLAKDQGFRARSAFKLIQLNRKYDFLAKCRVLVDLCAAPGSWCQVAAKHMPVGSKIVGVDLVPIAPIRGVKTFVGDITDDKTRKIIVTYLRREPVDCVIHDGAPNVGGVWSRDLFEQNSLVLHAAKMASTLLRPGGWFVTKVFRSQDFHKLVWVMKQLFDKVEATKPLASRMESAEIFVVCAGYKAPKQLDPAMFNAQKVFSDVEEEKILTPSGALALPKSNVPLGYEEFATIQHHVATFSDFLNCSDPKSFLRSHHELRFTSPEDKALLRSKYSKKELVYLCGDLQQVGNADVRRMIRWREQILREKAQQLRKQEQGRLADGEGFDGNSLVSEGEEEEEEEEEDKIDFDSAEGVARIARELLELRKKQSKQIKKKQKKIIDRKLKQIRGLINYDPNTSAEHMTDADGFEHGGSDDECERPESTAEDEGSENDFTVEKLALVDEVDVAGILDKYWEEPGEQLNDPLNPVVNVNINAEKDWDLGSANDDEMEDGQTNPGKRCVAHSIQLVEGQEDGVDVDNYGNYVTAKRSARVTLFEEGITADADEEGEVKEDSKAERRRLKDEGDLEAAGKQSKWLRHHVNIEKVLRDTFPTPRDNNRAGRKSKRLEEDRIEMTAHSSLDHMMGNGRTERKKMRFDDGVGDSDDDDDDDDDDDVVSDLSEGRFSDNRSDLEINEGRVDPRRRRQIVPDIGRLTTQELVRQQRRQTLKDNAEKRRQRSRQGGTNKETEFEEVPVALTDPEIRARTLAIATRMLDPRSRRDILEASINRYTFNDDDDLPDWFVRDEQRHCRVILPVTAEEVEAQRKRFKELNARPSKKVMEAVQRKRRRAQRMLKGLIERGKLDPRAREKANNMSVRKFMRSQAVKGNSGRRKKGPLDKKKMGEMRRERQKAKRRGRK